MFAELGTSGSVDGSRRLVIKGRFQQKQIENVLRRYIVEYVTCKTCRSPDSDLTKGENRLYFVRTPSVLSDSRSRLTSAGTMQLLRIATIRHGHQVRFQCPDRQAPETAGLSVSRYYIHGARCLFVVCFLAWWAALEGLRITTEMLHRIREFWTMSDSQNGCDVYGMECGTTGMATWQRRSSHARCSCSIPADAHDDDDKWKSLALTYTWRFFTN